MPRMKIVRKLRAVAKFPLSNPTIIIRGVGFTESEFSALADLVEAMQEPNKNIRAYRIEQAFDVLEGRE